MAPPPRARRPPRGRRGPDVAHSGAGPAHSRASSNGASPSPSRAGDSRSHCHPRRPRRPGQAASGSRAGQAASGRRARVRAAACCHATACHSPASDPAACRPPAGDRASSRDATAGDAAARGCPGPSARGAATGGGDSTRCLSARRAASRGGPVQEQEQAQEEEAERQEEGARPCSRATQPAGARRAGAHRGGRVWPGTLRQRSEREQPAVRALGHRRADRHGCAFAISSVVKVKHIEIHSFIRPIYSVPHPMIRSFLLLLVGNHELFTACNKLYF